MPYQRISEVDKQRIVDAHNNDEDYVETARLLGVKRTTAWAIIRRFLESGLVVRPRGGFRQEANKVDEEMKNTLVEIVEEHAAFTLSQVKNELQVRLPEKPAISITTIRKILDGQLMRMKKLEDAPIERNNVATKRARQRYAQWMMEEGMNRHLVFVDEAGFNLHTRRTRGRAHVGERAVRQVAGCRGSNLNLLMAISPEAGMHYFELHVGTVNRERFNVFLQNLGVVLGEEFDISIVMDNAPIHNGVEMDAENHQIVKLPAYSPMLNPIEHAFSCVKAAVKQLVNTRMAEILDRAAAAAAHQTLAAYRMGILRQCVTQVLEDDAVITQIKCENWHRHTFAHMPACMNMQDIIL